MELTRNDNLCVCGICGCGMHEAHANPIEHHSWLISDLAVGALGDDAEGNSAAQPEDETQVEVAEVL